MIRSVKLLTGVLLLCLAGLWAEVPQAFLGKSARLELDGVQFYLEHYNGAWQRTIDRNVVVEQSSQEPIPKRVGRIQTVDGKFRFVLTLAPQSDGQELSLAVTTEQPISTQIVAMTLNIPCGVLPVVPVSINGKDALLKMPEKQQMLRQGRASSLVLPGQTGQIVMTGENFSYSLNYNTHTGKRYLMRLICTPNETKTEYRLKVKFAWRPVKLVQFPLAKAANMGFVDNVEGDRKGGWTDQGPTADLRSLKSGRHSAGQFYFDIPGERRAIVLSGGLARPYFPVTVTVPSVSGNYAWLYLVHTSAWARNQKTPGTVTACYQDGTEQRFPVTFGEELIDWTEQEEDLPNGNIVWQGTTPKFPKILLFASRFPLDRNKTLTGVRFDSSKQAVWGIVSVSAQPDGPACAFYERNQHETFQEGPDWAVIDWQPKVPVLPGSALDLSQQRNPFDGPGARIVIRDGHFEREDTPGKRVFLNGINLCQEVTYPPKEIAEDMALRLAKNGYNAVRLHHFDWRLSSPGAPNIDLRENFNRFFYLIHQLEKNGIYYSIDYFSQRRVSKEMAALPLRQVLNKTKSLLAYDPAVIENMQSFARELSTTVNPYTGKALKDDPGLLPFNIINENPLTANLQGASEAFNHLKTEAAARYSGFLAADSAKQDRLLGCFVAERQRQMFRDWKAFLHSIGMNRPFSDMSMSCYVTQIGIRKEYDFIENHIYHANYSFEINNNPKQDMSSPMSNWLQFPLALAPTRYWGKAFVVGEAQLCGYNNYRHQFGTLLAAVAGLQGWDQVNHYSYSHHLKRLMEPTPMERLNIASDPLMLHTGRILALLHPARSRIDIPYVVTKQYLEEQITTLGGKTFPRSYQRLGNFAALSSIQVDEDSPALAKALCLVVPAQMKLPDFLKKYRVLRDDQDLLAELHKLPIPPGTGLKQDGKLQRVVSSTGEIEFCQDRSLKVVTPTAESFLLHRNASAMAGNVLQVQGNHRDCNLFLSALDGAPLSSSKRMLLLFLTDLKNNGVEFRNNTVTNFGKLPLIVQKGTVLASLALSAEPQVWALDYTGHRRLQLPVKKVQNGFQVRLDSVTAKDIYYAFEVLVN